MLSMQWGLHHTAPNPQRISPARCLLQQNGRKAQRKMTRWAGEWVGVRQGSFIIEAPASTSSAIFLAMEMGG